MAERIQANGMSTSDKSAEKDKRNVEENEPLQPEGPTAEDKVKRDRQVMMRVLSQGDAPLWDNPMGWDVLILCKQLSWRLHRSILSQCSYFTSRMIPWGIVPDGYQDTGSETPRIQVRVRYYLLILNNHEPGQIANVLRFLYFQDCAGTAPYIREPLYGDCLLTSTALFIAAASVACQPMMDFLSTAIFRYAAHVSIRLTPAVARDSPNMDYTVLRLAIPLRIALTMLYEQPTDVLGWHRYGREDGTDDIMTSEERGRSRGRGRKRYRDGSGDGKVYEGYGILWPLRRMLVRFAADVLPQLAANAAFHAQFRTEWEGSVFLQQLEGDMAALVREAKVGRDEKMIARADTALSLLHELTRAEQALIAAVLRRQGEVEESEAEYWDEEYEEYEEYEGYGGYEEEKEVTRIVEQLDSLGLE